MQTFFAVWHNSFLWFDTIYLIVHQQVAAWTQLLKRYIIQHCIKHSVYTRENRLQWKPLFLHIFCSRVLTIFWFCIWIFHKLNFQKKYMELMIFYWRRVLGLGVRKIAPEEIQNNCMNLFPNSDESFLMLFWRCYSWGRRQISTYYPE